MLHKKENLLGKNTNRIKRKRKLNAKEWQVFYRHNTRNTYDKKLILMWRKIKTFVRKN